MQSEIRSIELHISPIGKYTIAATAEVAPVLTQLNAQSKFIFINTTYIHGRKAKRITSTSGFTETKNMS